jgi:hypothetical protein
MADTLYHCRLFDSQSLHKVFGILWTTFATRLSRGWPIEDALSGKHHA